MEVVVEGENAADVTRDLRDWLHNSQIEGVAVEFAPGKPLPDAMGIEPVTTLLLFLKTKVVGEVISAIKTWIKVSKPRVKVTFKTKKGTLTLDAENTTIDEKLVENLRALMAEVS